MGSLFRLMSVCFGVCFLSYSCLVTAESKIVANGQTIPGSIFIGEKEAIATVDDDFSCATLDWWPPEKCDNGNCSWHNASILNLDLNNSILFHAVKAFSPLKLRLGGTLQDKVIYETEDLKEPCTPFVVDTSEMFNFTQGCLPMHRWDELNNFFKKTGAKVIFGLNALPGRTIQPNGSATGDWDSTNAKSFLHYTVNKGYSIYGWELGNELSEGGGGTGTNISADQYASDIISLHNIIQDIYNNSKSKPLVIAPGGGFNSVWFKEFFDKSTNFLDVATIHMYNLGGGDRPNLVDEILDPKFLDWPATTFQQLQDTIRSSETSAIAWVGESGGAYNSGRDLVTNAFVSSFWYLNELGMSSVYGTKTHCRQTLIGGNYGLLDAESFLPNPDYYSALLWRQLMGRNVLKTSFSGSDKILAYAHCAKQSEGITFLLINLDGNTTVMVNINFNNTDNQPHKHWSYESMLTMLPGGSSALREEYHLTAENGDLHSRTMLLNGNILAPDLNGDIPQLVPRIVDRPRQPMEVEPYSVVFVHMPNVVLPACAEEAISV